MAAPRPGRRGISQMYCMPLSFPTCAGAPPLARTDADASPRIHSPRLGVAAGASSFNGGGAPPPPRTDADASPRIHSPRLGVAAGAYHLIRFISSMLTVSLLR